MVSLVALWLPILVASIIVFIAGYVMNMLLPHHRTDFARLTDEDAFGNAVRSQGLAQGQYVFPYASSPADLKDEAYQAKVNAGPMGMLVVWPSGMGALPKQLAIHFVYILVISLFAGYIGSATLPAGVDYLKVFQVVGTVAFMGYAGASSLNSIWYHFSWSWTIKQVIDGLVYGLLTAGTFGWLWP